MKYSLRTLIILVTIICVVIGHFAGTIQRTNHDIAKLKLNGCVVITVDYGPKVLRNTWLGQYWQTIEYVDGIAKENSVHIINKYNGLKTLVADDEFNDQCALAMTHREDLSYLCLENSEVTARGLSHLIDVCPNLTILSVVGLCITNEEMAPICRLKQLEALLVSDCQMQELPDLSDCKSLRSLVIWGTNISLESLYDVARLPHITSITLSNGSISIDERDEFTRQFGSRIKLHDGSSEFLPVTPNTNESEKEESED